MKHYLIGIIIILLACWLLTAPRPRLPANGMTCYDQDECYPTPK